MQVIEQRGQRTAGSKIILGVGFEPSAGEPTLQPVGVMHAPQADAGAVRDSPGQRASPDL
jgi:hypothetical protein